MTQDVMVQIFESDFNEAGLVQTVNARDLHEALGVNYRFNDWIKEQLQDFKENQDFIIFTDKPVKIGKGRPRQDYALTLDTAKHICMMSRCEKGKQLREKNMNEMIVSNNADTINSQTLLQMVNEARKLCGEPSVRNNNFIEKILDELEGEDGYTKSATVPPGGGTPMVVITMTYKQAMRVAARESKAVRRSLIDQLEELQQKALAAPQQQPQLIPGTPEHFLDFITQGVTQALTQAYRSYFGEPVQNALPVQQQHTEPVALPPAGVHNPCPANKISLNKMKNYVSNETLLKELINGFGLVGELFDPGCVEGTNKAARPYMVYNKNQVAAMLKAAQVLADKIEGGKRRLLGRTFSVKTNVAPHLYDGFDFDAACEMILLLKAKQC